MSNIYDTCRTSVNGLYAMRHLFGVFAPQTAQEDAAHIAAGGQFPLKHA
jgi:hypothetical protein